MTQEQQPKTEKPPKKRCAWQGDGIHYFTPSHAGQIFCSHACQRKDDKDRPQ